MHHNASGSSAEALGRAIGERVRSSRVANDFTLDQLAQRAGVSRRMLINIEHGTANPSMAILLRIGDALG
ncbi:MAG: helix-turn-helix domain-containing protein, partial [Chloroflexi bacterium]|nr:helix-turn-helix domain-containing protein [Chloroflexota bacterium]